MYYWCCSDCFAPSQPRDWSQCLKNLAAKCHYCGSYPLHEAISSDAPDDVILALLAADRIAAMTKINYIDLPLHKAIECKCSDKIVLALVVANVGAAVKESANGELPLHWAIKSGYSAAVVMAIFGAFPCAAMIRCKLTGMLPLHLAAASSASPRLVEALIKGYPEALEIVANGATPRDLVTAALPEESIKMICRPTLHLTRMLSNQVLPERAVCNLPALETLGAAELCRHLSRAGPMQLSEAQTVKFLSTQVSERINAPAAEAADAAAHSRDISLAAPIPKVNSVKSPVCSKPIHLEPKDQAAKLPGVNSVKVPAHLEKPNVEPKEEAASLSEVNSVKAQVLPKCTHTELKDQTANLLPRQLAKGEKRIVQHNYHDHSNEMARVEERHPCISPEKSLELHPAGPYFPLKLHKLLDTAETEGHGSVISWQPHGRAFKIHKVKEFVEKVMPLYFSQTKLESFHRQLNLYCFLRISQGPDKGAYYHELFLRGKLFLINKINRKKLKGTLVKAVSNPLSEPNFYTMPVVADTASLRVQAPQPSWVNL